MSDVKDQINKEFEELTGKFLVLFDARAENYFEAVMEIANIMSKRGKGVYITASRPYSVILREMQKRGINTDNILFLDCISPITGDQGKRTEKCIFVENPAALEEISMYINALLAKTESDEKFLIMDSVSTFLIYNGPTSVKEFSMFLINKLRLEDVNGILVIIGMIVSEDLKQMLIAMCDKVIYSDAI